MGRTLPTTTQLLRREIEEWMLFRNALPKKDRKEFDMMLKSTHAFNFAMMMSIPTHPVPFRPILMSIIFRHYQKVHEIEEALTHR